MILDILVFALGFLVAGLLALAALPPVWRRALRLTEERLRRLVPLSAEEIAAERDHLRAAHAVAVRRLEQKLEGSESGRAALRIEAARRDARIAALDEAAVHAQLRIAGLAAEAADLRREVAGLWGEHGAEAIALDGLARLAEARLDEIAALRGEGENLRHEADRSRASLAALDTRLIGAETRGRDLERELLQARHDAAAERPPADPHEVEGLKAELAFMTQQALSAEQRATESAKAHAALKRERGEGAMPGRRDDAALRDAIAALAEEVLRATEAPRT